EGRVSTEPTNAEHPPMGQTTSVRQSKGPTTSVRQSREPTTSVHQLTEPTTLAHRLRARSTEAPSPSAAACTERSDWDARTERLLAGALGPHALTHCGGHRTMASELVRLAPLLPGAPREEPCGRASVPLRG